MSRSYTPKQIEKYKRQKYISALSKCTKNLYKLFKNENISYEDYRKKFIEIKSELDKADEVRLDTEYLKMVQKHIDTLFNQTILDNNYTQEEFIKSKESQLSALNRLQKMRNRTKYNKTKHKNDYLEY